MHISLKIPSRTAADEIYCSPDWPTGPERVDHAIMRSRVVAVDQDQR